MLLSSYLSLRILCMQMLSYAIRVLSYVSFCPRSTATGTISKWRRINTEYRCFLISRSPIAFIVRGTPGMLRTSDCLIHDLQYPLSAGHTVIPLGNAWPFPFCQCRHFVFVYPRDTPLFNAPIDTQTLLPASTHECDDVDITDPF